jgi:hypothetical protein
VASSKLARGMLEVLHCGCATGTDRCDDDSHCESNKSNGCATNTDSCGTGRFIRVMGLCVIDALNSERFSVLLCLIPSLSYTWNGRFIKLNRFEGSWIDASFSLGLDNGREDLHGTVLTDVDISTKKFHICIYIYIYLFVLRTWSKEEISTQFPSVPEIVVVSPLSY